MSGEVSRGYPWLVVLETQKVKDFLFASPYLRHARGASFLLDRLNRHATKRLLRRLYPDAQCVYLGGGSGRVLFGDPDRAGRFASDVRELYAHRAPGARLSVQVVRRETGESVAAWMARGVGRSQAEKAAPRATASRLGGRWIRPCSACGAEAAEFTSRRGEDVFHLCRGCQAKQNTSHGLRDLEREPLPERAEMRRRFPGFVLTTLREQLGDQWQGRLPADFEEIGLASRPRGYFGLLYADGDRMGDTLHRLAALFPGDAEAFQAYKAFSEIVDEATREAAVEAVTRHVPIHRRETEDGGVDVLPVEILLAGGDDLILVVPAHLALPLAATFVQAFQRRTGELQEKYRERGRLAAPFAEGGLTTSAGCVICHASFPVSQAFARAAELLKMAKSGEPAGEGRIDFEILHEAGAESPRQRRLHEYRAELASGLPVWRTERPYTAAGLERLFARASELAERAPRSSLKALYAVLFRGIHEAQFEALRLKERWKASGALSPGSALAELDRELGIFPFREGSGGWTTPLSELIEVMELARPQGQEASR